MLKKQKNGEGEEKEESMEGEVCGRGGWVSAAGLLSKGPEFNPQPDMVPLLMIPLGR